MNRKKERKSLGKAIRGFTGLKLPLAMTIAKDLGQRDLGRKYMVEIYNKYDNILEIPATGCRGGYHSCCCECDGCFMPTGYKIVGPRGEYKIG